MKNAPPLFSRPSARSAFTLVELMVSMAIMAIILMLMARIIDSTGKTWASTTGKIEQFREARQGFETIVRRLSQATLNTYFDFDWGNPIDYTQPPKRFVRQSELRFISGPAAGLIGNEGGNHPTHAVFFHAPLGFTSADADAPLKNLINTWGYWVEYISDSHWRPPFVENLKNPPPKGRYRLMEMMEPSESMSVYTHIMQSTGSNAYTYAGKEWFTDSALKSVEQRPARPLADNIVALVLMPKLSAEDDPTGTKLAPYYNYDSSSTGPNGSDANYDTKNQLPPVVQVTVVAVDEKSFARMYPKADETAPPDTFDMETLFNDGNNNASAGDLHDPSQPGLAQDLQTLQTTLTRKRLTFRVFTTNVAIRAAKWSRAQTN